MLKNKERIETPLVSLCIPTYMRGEVLKKMLLHMVTLPEFDDSVQIVISDNASTDNTKSIVENIIEIYPQCNIKYYCNNTNIGISNFLLSLKRGDGLYCKLLNDYTCIGNESLRIIKSKVKEYKNQVNDIQLCFVCDVKGLRKGQNELICHGVDEVVVSLNNKITWVSNAGCFKSQIVELEQYEQYNDKLLSIEYWMLHLANTRETTVIVSLDFEQSITFDRSVRQLTYSFFVPHIVWYYEIINYFTKLPREYYNRDRKRLLDDYIGSSIRYFLILRRPSGYNMKGSWNILFRYFYDLPYFYVFLGKSLIYYFSVKLGILKR